MYFVFQLLLQNVFCILYYFSKIIEKSIWNTIWKGNLYIVIEILLKCILYNTALLSPCGNTRCYCLLWANKWWWQTTTHNVPKLWHWWVSGQHWLRIVAGWIDGAYTLCTLAAGRKIILSRVMQFLHNSSPKDVKRVNCQPVRRLSRAFKRTRTTCSGEQSTGSEQIKQQ